MALNPIAYTENVVRSFLRYQLTVQVRQPADLRCRGSIGVIVVGPSAEFCGRADAFGFGSGAREDYHSAAKRNEVGDADLMSLLSKLNRGAL